MASDSSVHGIRMEKKKPPKEEQPQPMKTDCLQAKYLIVEFVEQDMVYENARLMASHVNCKKQHNFKSMCHSLK